MAAWHFLVGDWRGSGRLRGVPLTSHTWVRELHGGALESEIRCSSGGREVHRERVLWFEHGALGPGALSVDHAGRATHWCVRQGGAARLILTPADYEAPLGRSRSWTLELRADGVLVETYRDSDGDGDEEPLVMLEHVRAIGGTA